MFFVGKADDIGRLKGFQDACMSADVYKAI